MNVHKILFPTDLSQRGNAALSLATSLAREHRAELVIAHVYEPPEPLQGMIAPTATIAAAHAQQAQQLERLTPPDRSIRYRHKLVGGSPSDGIVKLAADEGADLIVMATHGYSGFQRLLMGSVAESVVRRAACPVLTLKMPVEKAMVSKDVAAQSTNDLSGAMKTVATRGAPA